MIDHAKWQTYLTSREPKPAGSKGVCYLPELALLRFTGADTLSFLQGYLTSDAFELREDRLSPTALCNLKGRVVANGWCYKRDNGIDFIVHRSLTQTLCGFLKNYLVFSKTDLEDCSNSHMVFGSIEAESSSGLHFGEGQCLFVVEELATATKLYESEESLSPGVWAYRLIHDQIALVSLPVSERFLPQMLGLDRTGAVDFDKGCYLGQEVVARAQHRGKVKRELRRLSWQGERPPAGHELQTADGLISGVVIQADVDAPDGYCLAVSSAARAGQVAVNSQSATKFQSVP